MKSLTVVIGCKMPNGVTLELGGRTPPVKINGANEGEMREGGLFVPHTVGGFGRTEVDAKFWADWSTGATIAGEDIINQRTGEIRVKQADNRATLVKARKALVDEWQANGVLWVVDSADLALAQANEKAAVRTGFEPLAQSKDPRAPRVIEKVA